MSDEKKLVNPFFQPWDEKSLRCHVMSLPNAPSSAYYTLSHFAQKIRNLCWMLKSTGNAVYYYGFESCDVVCDEKIKVVDEDVLMEAYPRCHSEFGHVDINEVLDNPDGVEYLEKLWTLQTAYQIKKRYEPGDFFFWMLPMAGQRFLYDELKDLPVRHVEPGIGYIGAFLPYKVFQSNYIRDFHYGYYHGNNQWFQILGETSQKERPHGSHAMHTYVHWEDNRNLRDTVISNSYDLDLFDFRVKKEDYLLSLARVLRGKGIRYAVAIAEQLDMKLIVAGPGDFEEAVGKKPGGNIEVLGPVGVEDRRDLISKAYAILSLSDVDETFGGAAIEGLISGTSPIVSRTGGFRDTIRDGENGFCVDPRNVKAGIRAVEKVSQLDPYKLRGSGLWFSREVNALRHNAYYQNIDRELMHGEKFQWVDVEDIQNIEWSDDWMLPVDEKKEMEDD